MATSPRGAARCPICHAVKFHGDDSCPECRPHLTVCQMCGRGATIIAALCADCTAAFAQEAEA